MAAPVEFGFERGHVVQEYYVDVDSDESVRSSIEEATGTAIVRTR